MITPDFTDKKIIVSTKKYIILTHKTKTSSENKQTFCKTVTCNIKKGKKSILECKDSDDFITKD